MLAKCGTDTDGRPYVHVKAFRGDRIFTEVVAVGGTVKIHCRECLRWFTVNVTAVAVESKIESLPDALAAVI